MKDSVKIILSTLIIFSFTFQKSVSKISNVRLTTAKAHLHPATRKLFVNPLDSILGGGTTPQKDNGETTIMLLGVMERQQQIKKIKALIDNLHDNLEGLKTMIDSQVSQLSQLANASLSGDKFIIDAK